MSEEKDKVPSREQVKALRNRLGDWRERVDRMKSHLMAGGLSEEEAQRVVDPIMSFWMGQEEEVSEYEAFYRMEDEALRP